MAGKVNYELKYKELKSKFMEAVDMAFRHGYEAGAQAAQVEQMAQQQQMQMEQEAMMQQNAMGGGDPNASMDASQGAPQPGAQDVQGQPMQESENPNGTELDQHIAQLESLLGKSEISPSDLKKAVSELKALQAKRSELAELKKSAQAIPAIAKALHKPAFKIGKQASHNLSANAKQAVTMQNTIVNNVMKAWENETVKASKDIKQVLNVEGLTKTEE